MDAVFFGESLGVDQIPLVIGKLEVHLFPADSGRTADWFRYLRKHPSAVFPESAGNLITHEGIQMLVPNRFGRA